MSDGAGWAGFSPEDMGELIRYLQPWFETRGSPSTGIQRLTSLDKTVKIKHPSGPVSDLSVTEVSPGVSLPMAAKNSTGIDIGSSSTRAQVTFSTGSTHYASNDSGAFFSDAGAGGVNILQPGMYLVAVAASNVPSDGLVADNVYLGGDPTSGLGGNNDGLMAQRDANPVIAPGLVTQQAWGIYAVVADDITEGVVAGLSAVAPSGWDNDEADHNVTVTRLGDIGTFPPTGFD